ncbi:phytanoyl-CoA dioxygenase family protein [Fibrella forsythiae]|uniref:Phytanoyl-CoA dioxygenase family protein n=1 Tax=Fibrella forsythiae TaxID=2817061 RepID=A0ABS3JIX0_9BACT|nr:phytanoyl-CoA dioxygenase family protein [Fibrella forsythiae]MBO0949961.1 phytanoyl-CoA dioxygenase family protein [Fibrella forsythiae]
MESKFKDRLRRLYRMAKHKLNDPQRDFDVATLPWIDLPGADIDAFLATYKTPSDFPYDLKSLLTQWRDQGYVILEGALPISWVDGLWQEVETTIDQHEQHSLKASVYQFNDKKETPIKDVPKEKLAGIGARLLEYHNSSVAAKKVMTHRHIATFLDAVFHEPVCVLQSLIFKYGSQQDTHQDFPWVRSKIASHLAAAWIPLEDVHIDAGPLYYYPGSHRMPKFDFGTGILHQVDSFYSPEEFSVYLDKTCAKLGIPQKTLLLKKGDLLLWHGGLAHGGNRIGDATLTRKSFVCHYSTVRSYSRHRFEAPEVDKSAATYYNDITIYVNPENAAEEDKLAGGAAW